MNAHSHNPDPLWTLDDICLNGGAVPRLDRLSVRILPGVTAVLGPSGAGKSSLLNLLVGYELPDGGSVEARLPGTGRSIDVYWVPQNHGLWPHLTAREHLEKVAPPGGRPGEIDAVLSSFDIADKSGRYPDQLSQGERARLSVARALLSKAPVLVMDEPLMSVDRTRAGKYWEAIRRHLEDTGTSLVFATHSPETVLSEAQRVICMAEGRLLYDGDVMELYRHPPTPELAESLGEANWLAPEDAALWLGAEGKEPVCYRPEQIAVEPTDDGPIVVRSSRFKGSVAEVHLEHENNGETRRFFCRPPGDVIRSGQRVALKLLLSLVLLFAASCSDTADPSIPVTSVSSRQSPADGPTIPAPRGIGVASDGKIVTIDTAGRILVFSEGGRAPKQWRMPEWKVGTPEDLTVLRNGNILVPDTHYHRVMIFTPEGEIALKFGKLGRGPGEFLYPVSAAEDDEGSLYVCEYGSNDRVQKFSKDREFLFSFGSFGTGPGQFQRPAGIVWHEGKIYVADATNHRIQVFSDTGEFEGILGGSERPIRLRFPYDIAMGDGALYAVEWGAGRVTMIGLDGKLLGRYGEPGSAAGSLRTPWGVAFHPKGIILVADTGNRRIVELKL